MRPRKSPPAAPDTLSQLKLGRRVLRVRDRVKIRGEKGLFKVLHFNTLGTEVLVYGGPEGRERLRTFRVERIGTRPEPATLERKGVHVER